MHKYKKIKRVIKVIILIALCNYIPAGHSGVMEWANYFLGFLWPADILSIKNEELECDLTYTLKELERIRLMLGIYRLKIDAINSKTQYFKRGFCCTCSSHDHPAATLYFDSDNNEIHIIIPDENNPKAAALTTETNHKVKTVVLTQDGIFCLREIDTTELQKFADTLLKKNKE